MADYNNTRDSSLPDPASPGFLDGDTITLQNGSKFSRQCGRWEPIAFQSGSAESPVTAILSAQGIVSAGEKLYSLVSIFGDTPFGGVPIADASCTMPDSEYTTTISGTSAKKWKINRNASHLRLVYVNWYNNVAPSGKALAINASVESSVTAGTRYQAKFGNETYAFIATKTWAVSDSIAINVVGGGYIYTRTNSCGPGNPYKSKNPSVAAFLEFDNHAVGSAGLDATVTGAPSANAFAGYSPLCVVGDQGIGLPYVIVNGDSNNTGTGDTNGANLYGKGWCDRLLGANGIPRLNVSYDGRQISDGHDLIRPLFAGCTDIFVPLIINDLSANVGNRSLANYQNNALAEWKRLHAAYPLAHIWQFDAVPNTTSADVWATVENQTPLTSEPVRLAANGWLADGAPLDATTLAAVATGTTSNVIRAGRLVGGSWVAGDAAHPIYAIGNISTPLTAYKANGDAVWAAGYCYPTDNLGIHLSATACDAVVPTLGWIIPMLQTR